MKKFVMFFLICILLSASKVQATENDEEREPITFNVQLKEIQDSQISGINYDAIQQSINAGMGDRYQFDYKQLVNKIIGGQYDLEGKTIVQLLFTSVYRDVLDNTALIVRILIISVIAAFFKTMTSAFENKQIAEMGFFVVFLLITTAVIQSYNILNGTANDLIVNMITFIEALVPSLLSVTVLSGATISSVMFSEAIIMLIGIINGFVKTILLPFLYILIIFVVLNTITDESSLSKMIALLKKGYEWTLKIMLWLFIGIFGLQSFGLPVVDGLITRTTKQSLGIVPVVGSTLSEISDIVLGCGTVIKNAFGVGAIIAIILIALTPVVKIAVIALAYKVSAAFIEPISEGRLVTCLSEIGDVCFLLLGTVLLVVLLFVIVIAMTLFITNTLLY
ncbi:MAG: stage III sporulation protein AE, partial [Vallitaleaceae bacterium]|nr:stage III sporulation protein AE [Vallitaleaceae bacterium]